MPPPPVEQIHAGSAAFRRITFAICAAGFATFALLYCVQPLMPVFARDFHVSAAQSSLSLSLTTGLLAPAMLFVGTVSESFGRKPLMVLSLFLSAALTLASALVQGWHAFLVLRAVAGLTFAGLPAITMAYLSEEVHPSAIGLAMGLSIGANGLGGMIGRLAAAFIAEASSWRYAFVAVGALGVAASVIAWRALPASRQFVTRSLHVPTMLRTFRQQFRDPLLVALFAIGFVLMGAFVTTYDYVTYHLLEPRFGLSAGAAGSIFLVYIVGIFASAYIGAAAHRVGRRRMLRLMIVTMLVGIALATAGWVPLIVLGVATVTFGFFGGHSVASSWVGLRARTAKGQASALYLFFYYMGASVAGSVGGMFWDRWHWPGVVTFVVALLLLGLVVALVDYEQVAVA